MREDRGLVLGICKIILLLKLSKYTSFLLKQQIISQITNVLITHLRCLAVKLQLLRYIFTVRSMSNLVLKWDLTISLCKTGAFESYFVMLLYCDTENIQ